MYLWNSKQGIEGSRVLDELPYALKRELLSFLNRDVIKKVAIFATANDDLIDTIASCLKPIVFLQGFNIVR